MSNNLAYDLVTKHILDDRPDPYVWFVRLFASKPLPANENERPYIVKNFNNNQYPDTTAHRSHLKGQEAAEAYLIKKKLNAPHVWGRRILFVTVFVLSILIIGGLI